LIAPERGTARYPSFDGHGQEEMRMGFVLWLIAVIIGIVGIVQLLQGQIILGIILLVVAFLVGPGGYSVFRSRA
jgi:TM2 domain-containing membrane protein YozV